MGEGWVKGRRRDNTASNDAVSETSVSQFEAADKLNVSRPTVQRAEKEEIGDHIERALELGIRPEDISFAILSMFPLDEKGAHVHVNLAHQDQLTEYIWRAFIDPDHMEGDLIMDEDGNVSANPYTTTTAYVEVK